MYARSKNPLLHPDALFHMSSLGRQQARYLATVQARSKEAVEERRHQLLHDKGEEAMQSVRPGSELQLCYTNRFMAHM
jgi:hypothetical protein